MSLIDQIRAQAMSPEGISDEEMQGFQNIKAVNQDTARQAAQRTVKRPPQRSPIADAAASAGRPAPQAAGRGGLDSLPPEVVQQLMKAKAAQEAPSQRTDERDPKALIMKLIQMLTGGGDGERVEDPRVEAGRVRPGTEPPGMGLQPSGGGMDKIIQMLMSGGERTRPLAGTEPPGMGLQPNGGVRSRPLEGNEPPGMGLQPSMFGRK